jgi:hemolysin activation/secretion protein
MREHRRGALALSCSLSSLLPGLLAASPAFAQQPPRLPPALPGVIERVAPAEPPALGPRLLPPEPSRATGPGETRSVALGRATVQGNTALPEAALRPALDAVQDRTVTLAEIEDARLAVLGAYRAAGFPYVAVTARLAPQADGRPALVLVVTEGHVAALRLEGEEIGPATRQARRFLEQVLHQRPLPAAALERALLLAGDIPGMEARGVLRPIEGEPGALELVVRLARRPVSGFATLDNRGYLLTGRWQGLVVGQLNSLTALGERTEVAVLQTDGNGQGFFQVTEEMFLGASGLRLRLYAGAGRAEPGSALGAIGYAGETRVGGMGLAYPLIRSRPLNINLTGQFDAFESEVEARNAAGAPRTRQSLDSVRALRVGVDGAVQDALVGSAPAAAVSAGLVRLSQGIEALGASDGAAGTTARLGSEFGFTRLVAEASRLQPLFMPAEGWLLSVLGVVAGQWSDDVLPPAEKFYLGGNRLGRGFYAGQVTGDRALAGTLEVQLGRTVDLAMPADWPGGAELRLGTQFYLFRDEGRAWDNGVAGQDRELASWGGGVRLQFDERVQLDLEAVRRLTRSPEGAGVAELSEDAVFARVLVRF